MAIFLVRMTRILLGKTVKLSNFFVIIDRADALGRPLGCRALRPFPALSYHDPRGA